MLDEEEWAEWDSRYQSAASDLDDRDARLAALYNEAEAGLELVGVTAIEDKLQAGVPESIHTLLQAGIKVFMRYRWLTSHFQNSVHNWIIRKTSSPNIPSLNAPEVLPSDNLANYKLQNHNFCLQVWVITGDKQETAINIAIACKLIRNPGSLLVCNEASQEAAAKRLEALTEHLRRQYAPVYAQNPIPHAGKLGDQQPA